ncbi:MAG: radical SAM protein [Candidatus Hydrothermarchaeota archaeon]
MENIKLKEIEVKSIINRSGILGVDLCINPYVGCQHGCVYCYARFMRKYSGHMNDSWGSFVDVKINAVEILKKQMKKLNKGEIIISSVTDPYQPLERRYNITRGVLSVLKDYNFPVSILTKSDLVKRDIDFLVEMKDCEVGFTIVTLNDEIRKDFEPFSSPIDKRLNALEELAENGIKTYVFLGPILPYLTEETLMDTLKITFEMGARHFIIDKLNFKAGNWQDIKDLLTDKYPELLPKYNEIRKTDSSYYQGIRNAIKRFCVKNKVPYKFCF